MPRKSSATSPVTEKELWDDLGGKMPAGKILMKDRIADSIFQQMPRPWPDEYSVLALPNLNGDYMSDAAIALWRSRSWARRQHV